MLATKNNKSLWAWGSNGSGELGLGDTSNRSSPVQVGALTDWLTISAGRYFSLANTVTAGTAPPPYTRYSGIWTLEQQGAAKGASTWPVAP